MQEGLSPLTANERETVGETHGQNTGLTPKTAQTSRTERRGLQGMRDSIHRSSAV
jgi:hypothetical protein